MRWDSPTPIILTRQGKSLAPLGGCNLAGQLQVSLRDTVFCQAKKDAVGGAIQALQPPWPSLGQGGTPTGKAATSQGGPCATLLWCGYRWFQKFSSIQTLLDIACPIIAT